MLRDLLRAYYYLDANILRGFDAITRLRWQIGTPVFNIDVLSIIHDFRDFQQKLYLLFVILQVN